MFRKKFVSTSISGTTLRLEISEIIFHYLSCILSQLHIKMPIRRSTRARGALTSASSPPPPTATSRPRRAASGSTVKVTRDESNSPDESKKALRLTMKMPSSKLREATSNPKSRPGSRGDVVAQLTDSLTGGEIVSGPRASRANKKYVVESDSDEEESEDVEEDEIQASEEDQEDEEEEEEEQIGGPEESDDEEVAEEEDEDEDVDAEEDIEMEDDAALPPQPPILKVNGPAAKPVPKVASRPTVTLTPAQADKVKSVEAKEIEMDDDDEELSELSEDDEEDAEGDVDEDMGDDDDESRSPGSRGSTPDVSKMTKRQRSRLDQVMGSDFLQLPMGKTCPLRRCINGFAHSILQNLKRKSILRQRSMLCVVQKWRDGVRI